MPGKASRRQRPGEAEILLHLLLVPGKSAAALTTTSITSHSPRRRLRVSSNTRLVSTPCRHSARRTCSQAGDPVASSLLARQRSRGEREAVLLVAAGAAASPEAGAMRESPAPRVWSLTSSALIQLQTQHALGLRVRYRQLLYCWLLTSFVTVKASR